MKLKLKRSAKILAAIKECMSFGSYLTNSKYQDDSNKLLIGKVKNETGGVAVEKFVRLKSKMDSLFVNGNSEHKKAKYLNRNVVEKIIHN